MNWEVILGRFGDAGLVFFVMALVIYFLYKEYKREVAERKAMAEQYAADMKENNEKNLDTMMKFSNAMEKLSTIIKTRDAK